MALRREVINLVGPRLLHDADEVGRVRHVAIVQNEFKFCIMRILVNVFDPPSIEGRGPTLQTMDLVALFQQQTR